MKKINGQTIRNNIKVFLQKYDYPKYAIRIIMWDIIAEIFHILLSLNLTKSTNSKSKALQLLLRRIVMGKKICFVHLCFCEALWKIRSRKKTINHTVKFPGLGNPEFRSWPYIRQGQFRI